MTVSAAEGHANTVDFRASDVGYVPRAMGHCIENVGKDTMANTPHELVAAHLGIDTATLARLPQTKTPGMPA